MLRVYAPLLPGKPHIPLLYPNLGKEERDSILFLNRAFTRLTEPMVELVDDPAACDWILLPHNYPSVQDEAAYRSELDEMARRHNKRILVFWHGDRHDPVRLTNALVYRTSMYRHLQRPNEQAMPAYAEDLLGNDQLTIRPRTSAPPVVGFCGWAAYKNFQNHVGTVVKNGLVDIRAALGRHPEIRAERKGLSFRMEALDLLSRSSHIRTNFRIRSSYSGHAQTISMDPERARQEYRDNLLSSDLALVIKGDGNYSYRFYEALSLGRVPVLVDTQCVLPFEKTLGYDQFILRIDFRDLPLLDQKIRDWWDGLTNEKFAAMQQRAREAFVEFLRVESFYKRVIREL